MMNKTLLDTVDAVLNYNSFRELTDKCGQGGVGRRM